MQHVPILTLTRLAAVAITACRFVDFAGNHASAGEKAVGVSKYAAAAGDDFAVTVLGTAMVEAGAAVAAGVAVKSDANGKVIAQAGVGEIAGYSLQPAAGDGSIIEVLLTP